MIYNPQSFLVEEKKTQKNFLRQNPFASLITFSRDKGFELSKLPLLLEERGGSLVLEGHLAKFNGHWENLETADTVNLIFDGPHGYISPTWYEKPNYNVPTWNYVSLAVQAKAKVIEEEDWIKGALFKLAEYFERDKGWSSSVDAEYFKKTSKAVVGVEFEVIKIEMKCKMSQNKSKQEQENIIQSLEHQNLSLADFMKTILSPET